ncbi:hypothetical protein [Nocardiopsis composta]|uniref:Uncharacterized protein n=1 Tax=Nocardiopsis composta TaxID=157465 RepID=A0A7W8VG28_9ACTN|nr:hypothetical protein [Nocardiopsis composta]MBB5435012.1 hypothetical protein [Nocardiopsis composta]
MSGLSILPYAGTDDETTDIHIFSPELLSDAQCMGDACAICHARWPRPRHPLGVLPDGGCVFGCAECSGIVAAYDARSEAPEFAVR